jgi:hypothetical protein
LAHERKLTQGDQAEERIPDSLEWKVDEGHLATVCLMGKGPR